MRNSLANLEIEKPELRGFTNLFDIIISENNLRIDNYDLIESFPVNYQAVAQIFLEIMHNFRTYDDLNSLCDAQDPPVLALLFLGGLRQIFSILELPVDAIKFYLDNLCVNPDIINIFNLNIGCDNHGDFSNRTNFILYLCLISSQASFLPSENIYQIQAALEQARLPSLTRLVAWGFVSLES